MLKYSAYEGYIVVTIFQQLEENPSQTTGNIKLQTCAARTKDMSTFVIILTAICHRHIDRDMFQ